MNARGGFYRGVGGLWLPGFNSAPAGSSPIAANLYVDFESGINGDAVNAAYMNANDKGTPPNAWYLEGTAGTVSTSQFKRLVTPVTVDGTTYTDAGGTRGAAWSHASAGDVGFQFSDDPALNDLTFACWWKSTMPQPDGLFGTYDFISLENRFSTVSEWSVMQLNNWNLKAHSNGTPNVGSDIAVNRDTWYWVVLKNQRGVGSLLTVYNEDGSLRGSSSCLDHASSGSQGTRFVEFGNHTPHASFPTGSVFFDNVVIIWGANPAYPVGP